MRVYVYLILLLCQVKYIFAIVSRASISSDYGPWIVKFRHSKLKLDRKEFEQSAKLTHRNYHNRESSISSNIKEFRVLHSYEHALNAIVVEGLLKSDLISMNGVEQVHNNGRKYLTSISWGIDRLDQLATSASNSYSPHYFGTGVDVYIIDSGIDSNHSEFLPNGFSRNVSNIFNSFGSLALNIDGNGHGTSIAGLINLCIRILLAFLMMKHIPSTGIVGGNTNGVAKGASIFGLKAVDDNGDGYDSDIISAIDFVLANRVVGRRQVINLSLGGSCSNGNCDTDPLVMAVNNAAAAGVIVVVSAGNDFCNAAGASVGSPGSATGAITVAASNRFDALAYYSNYGQKIDIIAPGHSVVTACSSLLTSSCNAAGMWTSSGTSMAAPHVSGVVAQLLEKNYTATPQAVLSAMQCDALKGAVAVPDRDTITPNLLLQTPKNTSSFTSCVRGGSCTSQCSGRGYCGPAHLPSSQGSVAPKCFCDGNYDDATGCSLNISAAHALSCANGMAVTITMTTTSSKGRYMC
jgi:subtilisin family serine protease